MAANTLPSGIGDLFQLAERMSEGLTIHGRWLLPGSRIIDGFAELLTATQEAESAINRAAARKAEAAKRFADVDANLTSWLAKARLVVMLAHGNTWSQLWIEAGFTHRGTNVPKRIGLRMELSRRLAEFFNEHREYEVAFAEVTAERARVLQHEVTAAEQSARAAKADFSEKKHVRDNAEKGLRKKMRAIRILLSVSLGKSDPRWLAFGFKVPDANAQPRRSAAREGEAEPLRVNFSAAEVSAADAAIA